MSMFIICIGIMLAAAVYLLVFCMCWISAIGSRQQDPFFTGSQNHV